MHIFIHCLSSDVAIERFGRGEGVVSIVLKPLEAALRDHDRVYATVRIMNLVVAADAYFVYVYKDFRNRGQLFWLVGPGECPRCDRSTGCNGSSVQSGRPRPTGGGFPGTARYRWRTYTDTV